MSGRGLIVRCAVTVATSVVLSGLVSVVGPAWGASPSFGPPQTLIGATLDVPTGVAVDSAGDEDVADPVNSRVVELTPGGVQSTVPFTGLSGPSGVAVDASGDVFVAHTSTTGGVELTPAGVQTTLGFTGLSSPNAVAVDSAGDVYVTDTGHSQIMELPALKVAPSFTSPATATFTEGSAGSFAVTANGSPAPTFSEVGTLPAGVTLASSGVLSGTPTQDGTYPVTITATNGIGHRATQSFTLTVDSAPTITSTAGTTFTQGSAGSFTVTATGTPGPTFSVTGTLPTGVIFTSAGVLSGIPTQNGVFSLTVTASNGIGSPATQSFTLTVDGAPTFSPSAATTFTEGSAGSFAVTAAGTPTPSMSESGSLPSGVSFIDNGNGTATLSGTPTTGSAGTYPITITASNGVSPDATQSFTLTVLPIGITTTSLPDGSVYSKTNKVLYSATLAASGGNSPYKWSVASGSLPPGVKLSSKGVISGKAKTAGTYSFKVQVVDTKTKTKPPTQNAATLSITIG